MSETRTITMTVTGVAPVRVTADAAETEAPADVLGSAASYAIGDRVAVVVRNPWKPLVTGKVS